MVMNKKIVVRDSGIAGKGLYVVEKITKGEVVRAGGSEAACERARLQPAASVAVGRTNARCNRPW